MTARGMYEAMLVELNKVNAPSLLLEDYNYFINKAVNQYINKRYTVYDTSQQTTDDLRVLKATATIEPTKLKKYGALLEDLKDDDGNLIQPTFFEKGDLFGATYSFNLPKDYLHMLNCTCVYLVKEPYKCYPKDSYWACPARWMSADAWSIILNNAYMCPSYRRPYYYIHNVNRQNELPTNPYSRSTPDGTDQYFALDKRNDSEPSNMDSRTVYPRTVRILDIMDMKDENKINDIVDKTTYTRYANPTNIRCEIRYGKDDSVFELKYVLIDYLKAPLYIKLTQEQIDLTKDTSQILEFPDYVCQEIINELVTLVMENASDPRMNNHIVVTKSIEDPAQQLAAAALQQQSTKS